jgi:uncharacterized Zn finger protein (UPF0148 family)
MAEFVESRVGVRSFDDANSCPRCSGSLDAVAGQLVCATCGPLDEIMAPVEQRPIEERFPQTKVAKRSGPKQTALPDHLTFLQASPEVRKRIAEDERNKAASQKIAELSAKE